MGTRREISDIDTIVLHCAATRNGEHVDAEEIDTWHRERGFRRNMSLASKHSRQLRHIGYHYVVHTDGSVTSGRPLIETGAHVKGHNGRTVGVCIIGTDAFTPAQWRALQALVEMLRGKLGDDVKIVGHRDLSPDIDGDGTVEPEEWLKICPGFDVASWIADGMRPLEGHVVEKPA